MGCCGESEQPVVSGSVELGVVEGRGGEGRKGREGKGDGGGGGGFDRYLSIYLLRERTVCNWMYVLYVFYVCTVGYSTVGTLFYVCFYFYFWVTLFPLFVFLFYSSNRIGKIPTIPPLLPPHLLLSFFPSFLLPFFLSFFSFLSFLVGMVLG